MEEQRKKESQSGVIHAIPDNDGEGSEKFDGGEISEGLGKCDPKISEAASVAAAAKPNQLPADYFKFDDKEVTKIFSSCDPQISVGESVAVAVEPEPAPSYTFDIDRLCKTNDPGRYPHEIREEEELKRFWNNHETLDDTAVENLKGEYSHEDLMSPISFKYTEEDLPPEIRQKLVGDVPLVPERIQLFTIGYQPSVDMPPPLVYNRAGLRTYSRIKKQPK